MLLSTTETQRTQRLHGEDLELRRYRILDGGELKMFNGLWGWIRRRRSNVTVACSYGEVRLAHAHSNLTAPTVCGRRSTTRCNLIVLRSRRLCCLRGRSWIVAEAVLPSQFFSNPGERLRQ